MPSTEPTTPSQLVSEPMLMHYCGVTVSKGFANFTENKDFDENKENKTPEGPQGEVDWLQQYDMEREREEQELQQALAQSLQEQVRANATFSSTRNQTGILSWY